METKYLVFELAPSTKKTCTWLIKSKNSGDLLGVIKWYAPWRQYCIFIEGDSIFSRGCLEQIYEFINELMVNRKKEIVKK